MTRDDYDEDAERMAELRAEFRVHKRWCSVCRSVIVTMDDHVNGCPEYEAPEDEGESDDSGDA
jgi:hypothetical protein